MYINVKDWKNLFFLKYCCCFFINNFTKIKITKRKFTYIIKVGFQKDFSTWVFFPILFFIRILYFFVTALICLTFSSSYMEGGILPPFFFHMHYYDFPLARIRTQGKTDKYKKKESPDKHKQIRRLLQERFFNFDSTMRGEHKWNNTIKRKYVFEYVCKILMRETITKK